MTFLLNPPLEPGADEARELLERELTGPLYDETTSLFDRFLQWLTSLFGEGGAVSTGLSRGLSIGVIIAGALVISFIFWRTGPLRRNRRISQSAEVFTSPELSASTLRKQAKEAASAGNWNQAVVEQFRALVRALQDRVLVTDHTGLTAHEAVSQANLRFPAQQTELELASRSFSDVIYGKRPASQAQYEQLRGLDAQLEHTKPTRTSKAVAEVK